MMTPGKLDSTTLDAMCMVQELTNSVNQHQDSRLRSFGYCSLSESQLSQLSHIAINDCMNNPTKGFIPVSLYFNDFSPLRLRIPFENCTMKQARNTAKAIIRDISGAAGLHNFAWCALSNTLLQDKSLRMAQASYFPYCLEFYLRNDEIFRVYIQPAMKNKESIQKAEKKIMALMSNINKIRSAATGETLSDGMTAVNSIKLVGNTVHLLDTTGETLSTKIVPDGMAAADYIASLW